jgi:hypothetical protein
MTHLWKEWAEEKGIAVPDPKKPHLMFCYESIVKCVKERLKNHMESRKERMLTRLGINGKKAVRAYNVTGGGQKKEVGQ